MCAKHTYAHIGTAEAHCKAPGATATAFVVLLIAQNCADKYPDRTDVNLMDEVLFSLII